MHSSGEEHLGAATLEGHSLQKLGPEALEAVECHLLLCAACRDRLVGIEPFNTVHSTQNGLLYLRITQLRDGSFASRYWGCQIDGGSRHDDLAAACKYLLDSFVKTFPGHECGEGCGDVTPRANITRRIS
jgi:hypothetical protein